MKMVTQCLEVLAQCGPVLDLLIIIIVAAVSNDIRIINTFLLPYLGNLAFLTVFIKREYDRQWSMKASDINKRIPTDCHISITGFFIPGMIVVLSCLGISYCVHIDNISYTVHCQVITIVMTVLLCCFQYQMFVYYMAYNNKCLVHSQQVMCSTRK